MIPSKSNNSKFILLSTNVILLLFLLYDNNHQLFGQSPPNRNPKVDAILKVWEDRESKFQKIEVKYSQTDFFPKGSLTDKLFTKTGDVDPPFDTEHSYNQKIIIGNHTKNEIRLEANPLIWHTTKRVFEQKPSLSVYRQGEGKWLAETGYAPTPKGVLSDTPPPWILVYDILPITLWLRGTQSTLTQIPTHLLELGTGTKKIQDKICIPLKLKVGDQSEQIIWVADDTEALAYQIEYIDKNKISVQIDMEYRNIIQGTSELSAWKKLSFNKINGQIKQSATVKIESIRTDIEINDKTFDIIFPKDCIISDQRSNRLSNQENPMFIQFEETSRSYWWLWWTLIPIIILVGFILLKRFTKL